MTINAQFNFFKCVGGIKKTDNGGERYWARLTLVDETHEIFELFCSKDSAEYILDYAQHLDFNVPVEVRLVVQPAFDKRGYMIVAEDVKAV